jgi:hypothetical protein
MTDTHVRINRESTPVAVISKNDQLTHCALANLDIQRRCRVMPLGYVFLFLLLF